MVEPGLQFNLDLNTYNWQSISNNFYLGAPELKLGVNALLGSRYLSSKSVIKLTFGPMNNKRFKMFNKTKDNLIKLIKQYLDLFTVIEIHATVLIDNQLLALGTQKVGLGMESCLGNVMTKVSYKLH